MRAVRLHGQGPDPLVVEGVTTPRPASGEALVEVRAAAITRDELEWPQDRLPAIPSYELAGVVDDGEDLRHAVLLGGVARERGGRGALGAHALGRDLGAGRVDVRDRDRGALA